MDKEDPFQALLDYQKVRFDEIDREISPNPWARFAWFIGAVFFGTVASMVWLEWMMAP